MNYYDVFPHNKIIIGMVHLEPLPGSPNYQGNFNRVYERALQDLNVLETSGVHGAIVENFSDIPYTTENPLETVLAMNSVVMMLKRKATIPIGVNFQFNCAREEMAIAYVCGAEFIRVEAFVQNRLGPFGLTLAKGPEAMRYRAKLGAKTLIFADINVKHTYPVTRQDLSLDLKETVTAGADAIIVTGLQTGQNPSVEEVRSIKCSVPEIPLLIGSGVSTKNVRSLIEHADGIIVGSYIKKDGVAINPIDAERVRKLVELIKEM